MNLQYLFVFLVFNWLHFESKFFQQHVCKKQWIYERLGRQKLSRMNKFLYFRQFKTTT